MGNTTKHQFVAFKYNLTVQSAPQYNNTQIAISVTISGFVEYFVISNISAENNDIFAPSGIKKERKSVRMQ